MQTPPAFSAIKIDGERAYDLARDGEIVDLAPRPINVHALRLVACEPDCGGARRPNAARAPMCAPSPAISAARWAASAMSSALRRTRVGPFFEADSSTLAELLDAPDEATDDLLSVEAGLTELPCILLDSNGAARLRRGQSVILRGRDAPAEGAAYAVCSGVVIASGLVERGEFVPNRVFNLPF